MSKEIRIGEQAILCDREATAALYADKIPLPHDEPNDEESDKCVLWESFVARQRSLYSAEFLCLLSQLGADPLKDIGAYVCGCGPGQSHCPCGGYFVFVGELLEGVAWRPEHKPQSFTFWFTPHFPHCGLPHNLKLCATEFCTEIPSVIEEAHSHWSKPTVSLANLDENERNVIKECLEVAVKAPFYPDWEFGTIFGLERDDVSRILADWPQINEADRYVVEAINNSLNNILGYPARNKQEIWRKFISATPAAVMGIFDKWRGRVPRTSWKPRDYFEDVL